MNRFSKIEALKAYKQHIEVGKLIGFVPTMGALHQGHINLMLEAKRQCDVVICSIFVNPTQFNNPQDLLKYPRTLERDLEMLSQAGVDVVFTPEVKEMYPEKDERIFHLSPLDLVMEGKFRPGHFNGVAQIVSKLFDIVEPDFAFFGEKDFQQLAIIQKLVIDYKYKVKIVPVPTVREVDGLAMSSRNLRLTEAHRDAAPLIYKTLTQSKKLFQKVSVQETEEFVMNTINKNPFLEVEYFEIVDSTSLQKLSQKSESNYPVACIAVYAGEIRLIDNIRY